MMNALVRRYALGRSIQERIALAELWNRLEQEHRDESERLTGRLPTFGRTALAFIREMKERSIAPTSKGNHDGRRAPYGPAYPTLDGGTRTY